jgi:formylglycine-generating enzyme required for sulfatase activity
VDGTPWATGDCSLRVTRGGSWDSAPALLRAASRDANSYNPYSTIGIRLARDL